MMEILVVLCLILFMIQTLLQWVVLVVLAEELRAVLVETEEMLEPIQNLML
jgi:hypothetical protein